MTIQNRFSSQIDATAGKIARFVIGLVSVVAGAASGLRGLIENRTGRRADA